MSIKEELIYAATHGHSEHGLGHMSDLAWDVVFKFCGELEYIRLMLVPDRRTFLLLVAEAL